MKPITPEEATALRIELMPVQIIESFNELIALSFDGYESTIKQKAILALISKKTGLSGTEILQKNYLDIEDVYRQAGWVVSYAQPDRDDNFDPYFVFKKKGK